VSVLPRPGLVPVADSPRELRDLLPRAPLVSSVAVDMTTLVVGATGNIGLKTIEALRAKGKPVRGLVRPDSDAAPVEALGATVVRGDMMKPETLTAAFGAAARLLCTAVRATLRRRGGRGANGARASRARPRRRRGRGRSHYVRGRRLDPQAGRRL
jgi:uncharacterized protein YbjT (DUF2867 family)